MRINHIKFIFFILSICIQINRTTHRVIDTKSYTVEAVNCFFSFDIGVFMNKKGT
jgi:hypothetical protein